MNGTALSWCQQNIFYPPDQTPLQNFTPRSVFQGMVLSDLSPWKIYRTGRRMGKDTLVVMECLWFLFTGGTFDVSKRRKVNIIVLAPHKAQIDGFFDLVRSCISTAALRHQVKADNHSIIQKIVSTSDVSLFGWAVSSSYSLRNYKPDVIVLLEPACFDDKVAREIEKSFIAPLTFTYAETRLILAGTPSNKWFDEKCRSNKYSYYHMPADYTRPSGYSDEAWKREGLAELP